MTYKAIFLKVYSFINSQHAAADVEKMILGNKCDMNDKRQVSQVRGQELAVEYNVKFMETSAKNSTNVEEAFIALARDIKKKMDKKLVRFLFSINFFF